MFTPIEYENFAKTRLAIMDLLVRNVGLNCKLLSWEVRDYDIIITYNAVNETGRKTEKRQYTYNFYEDTQQAVRLNKKLERSYSF